MKIVHICMCDPYSENWSYHRNILSETNSMDGNETYIFATEYDMNTEGGRGNKEKTDYINNYGVHIYRFPDKFPKLKRFNGKINTVSGLKEKLYEIKPDIVMIHNLQTFNLFEIAEYKRTYPNAVLLADSHASFANSCRNWFSRWVVQGLIFRFVIRKNYNSIDGMYYIGEDELKFFRDVYGIREEKNSILPLPARFIDKKQKYVNREEVRKELGLDPDELLFVHSGKLSKEKKTDAILRCLSTFKNIRFKLLIIGSIPKEQDYVIKMIDSDSRFIYLGWKTSTDLMRYISAADLYLQPGSVSVTMNNSLAVGTPVMVFPHSTYHKYFGGWEILVKDEDEMRKQFRNIFEQPERLKNMSDCAYETAYTYFDCNIFAKEMYSYKSGKNPQNAYSYKDGIRYVSKTGEI